MKRGFYRLLGAIGLLLMALNLYGLTRSNQPPALADYTLDGEKWRPSWGVFREKIRPGQDESLADYAMRLTLLVHNSTYHFWVDAGDPITDIESRLYMRPPIWENWLVYGASFIYPRLYRTEYASPQRFYERGFGFCGHRADFLVRLLALEGIQSSTIRMDGHIVATLEIEPGIWWLLDPDFGLILPYDIQRAEQDRELVRTDYAVVTDPDTAAYIAEIYSNPEKRIRGTFHPYEFLIAETLGYPAKWLIPALLIGFGLVGVRP